MAEKKTIKQHLKDLLPQFVKNHPTSFYQGFLVALSGAFEQLWEEVGFKCPSSLDSPYNKLGKYQEYSLLNVLGPALALWMICLFGSNMAMRFCQGFCSRFEKNGCANCCYPFCAVFCRTAVIPLAWIFVALMDGDFLACYYYLPNCPMDSNMIFIDGINCTTNITLWDHANKIQSQVYGWYFLIVCSGILFGVLFIGRCGSKRTYFPNLYSNKLIKLERVEMKKLLEEKAIKTAEKNAGVIMMKMEDNKITPKVDEITPKDWEVISMEHPKKTKEYPMETEAKGKKVFYKHYSPFSEYLANHPEDVKKYEKKEKAESQNNSGNQVLTPNPIQALPENSVQALAENSVQVPPQNPI